MLKAVVQNFTDMIQSCFIGTAGVHTEHEAVRLKHIC